MSAVRTISLNDVVVGSTPTHIVIYQEESSEMRRPASASPPCSCNKSEFAELRARIVELERLLNENTPKPSPFFHSQISGPLGLDVQRMGESPATVFETLINSVRATPVLAPVSEALVDLQEEVQEEVQEETDDEPVDDEEEEEAMELTEFDYKGVNYYRDDDNQVYQKDEDGDLDDTPIGVWNEAKQKVIKYKT